MGKVLIIGAGGVGTVVAHKVAQNPAKYFEVNASNIKQITCIWVIFYIFAP